MARFTKINTKGFSARDLRDLNAGYIARLTEFRRGDVKPAGRSVLAVARSLIARIAS